MGLIHRRVLPDGEPPVAEPAVARHFIRRLALCLIGVAVIAVASLGGIAWHQGYRIYVVHTGSMVPTLRSGDAVLDRPAPSGVHPGEIVTFDVHSGPDSVVTHRVASIDGGIIKTKGDANRSVDPWSVHLPQVVGSAKATLPYMGYVLVYLQHAQGVASVLTVFLGLALLWQLFFPTDPVGPRRIALEPSVAETTAKRRRAHAPRHRLAALAAVPVTPYTTPAVQLRDRQLFSPQ